MLRSRFVIESRAQAPLEYLFLVGAVVIAAMIFIPIYKGGVKTATHEMGNSTQLAAKKSACEAGKELNMSDSLFEDRYNFSKSECADLGVTW